MNNKIHTTFGWLNLSALILAFLLGGYSIKAQQILSENRSESGQSNEGSSFEGKKKPGNTLSKSSSGRYDWQGFYLGGHLGYGWGKGDTKLTPLPDAATFLSLAPTTVKLRPRGAGGGFQGGYNWQYGKLVIGDETDFNWSSMKRSVRVSPIIQNNGTPWPGTPPGNDIVTAQDAEWFGTLRGRIGVAFNRILVYGTTGMAYGRVVNTANTDFRPAGSIQYPAALKRTSTGWTAGGGIEIGVRKYFSFKSEYLYYDLGNASVTANPTPVNPPYRLNYTWGAKAHTWNIGFNFHF